MSNLNRFSEVSNDLAELSRLNHALEAYSELLEKRDYELDSPVGRALSIGLESIDPTIDLKEGSYITLRMVKEVIVKIAKAVASGIKTLYGIVTSLLIKFTGSIPKVKSQHARLAKRLSMIGSKVTYKQMEIAGINKLSVSGVFIGDDPNYINEIIKVTEVIVNKHPKAMVNIARNASRNFLNLVLENKQADKKVVAQHCMAAFLDQIERYLKIDIDLFPVAKTEINSTQTNLIRSRLMPGNYALLLSDVKELRNDIADIKRYDEAIRKVFFINFMEVTETTADNSTRMTDVPSIKKLNELMQGLANLLDIAAKADRSVSDFKTVKVVVDDAIRQLTDVDEESDGNANAVVIHMLGAISEKLAEPVNNFIHWVAVTVNVYLNYINYCIKHYESDGV